MFSFLISIYYFSGVLIFLNFLAMFNLIYFIGAIIEPLVIILFTLVISILFFGKNKKIHHSHF